MEGFPGLIDMRNEHLERLDQFLTHGRRSNMGSLPPVVCQDGFRMSVQVGSMLYCTPRSDVGPWTTVEVGFPSRVEPLLWRYAETPWEWTDTVYPYTPIEVVAAVIELHNGFAMEFFKLNPPKS